MMSNTSENVYPFPGDQASSIASVSKAPHDDRMSDMNREEVKARMEASEARVATSIESLKGDFTGLRGEFSALRHEMASGQSRMDVTLAKILLAVEQGKSDRYATGYKVITWSIGTVIAITGIGIVLYKTFVLKN